MMRQDEPPAVPVYASFARRFWPLFAAGLAGIAALPLIVMPLLEARMRAGVPPGMSLGTLTALSLIQPAVLLACATAIGAALAHRLGFTSHLAGVNVRRTLRSEWPFALAAGVVTGIVVFALDRSVFRSAGAAIAAPGRDIVSGLVAGMLYGGLSEEIMMRWGLMSLAAWAGMRLLRRALPRPAPIYAASVALAAVVFAARHLPAASALGPLQPTGITRIMLLNTIPGLVFGWLFWRRSLESAIVAHASVHAVFAAARALPLA